MVAKHIILILILNYCCSSWCLPTRDLPEGVYIVRDERQKGENPDALNVHVKFDGLAVAVPVSGGQAGDIIGSLSESFLEAIFGKVISYHEKKYTTENILSVTPNPTQQQTETEKSPETTTIDTSDTTTIANTVTP